MDANSRDCREKVGVEGGCRQVAKCAWWKEGWAASRAGSKGCHLRMLMLPCLCPPLRYRPVSPAESLGYSCREKLAGDGCQHSDNHRRRLPDALSGPGEEKGEAGGGGL